MVDETKKEEEKIYREKRARWQGRQITQLGFVNNLFIVLATGVLAFQTDLIFKYNQTLKCNKLFFFLSILLTLFSLGIGCYVTINRLTDFQKTTKMVEAKKKKKDERSTDEQDIINELKAETNKLGKKTWKFLKYQIYLLVLGIIVLAFISINLLFF